MSTTLERERDVAVQALWDAYAALGFDTDGDLTPAAHVAGMGIEGFARSVVRAAAEHRRTSEEDYDRDLAEAERRGAVKELRKFGEYVGTLPPASVSLDDTTLERIRWTAIDRADEIERGED